MYYCALYLEVLKHTPQISCELYNLVCFSKLAYIFHELSPKKFYNTYLNNIDMVLLRTSYRYGGLPLILL